MEKLGIYKAGEYIGSGAMGFACKGTAPDGSVVAIRILYPHLANVEEFLKSFKREAELAKKLSHPNVARILDFGEDNGKHFIVTEYIEGCSLREAMHDKDMASATVNTSAPTERLDKISKELRSSKSRQEVHFSVKNTIRIMREAADALQAASDIGLTHRDIKPQNIFLDKKGKVKLLDFGLAKDAGALASMLLTTGVSIGSPPYMSPEQHEGKKKIDTRSDLYSLGATAYHLLTGKPPFSGPTASAFARQHMEEIPKPACKEMKDVPLNLSQVIDRLLAKDPELRHQTAAELIEDLNRVERGEPPLKLYKGKKIRTHNPLRTYAVAAAVALICIGCFIGYNFYRSGNAKTIISKSLANAEYLAGKRDYDRAIEGLNETITEFSVNAPELAKDAEELRDKLIDESKNYLASKAELDMKRREAKTQRLAKDAESSRRNSLRACIRNAQRWMDNENTVKKAIVEIEKCYVFVHSDNERAELDALRMKAEKKLAARRPWAAVVDFTIGESVERKITGYAVAVKLEQSLGSNFQLVDRSQIKRIMKELDFQQFDFFDKSKAKKFGRLVGAEYLVTGSVVQLDREVTIAAKLLEIETAAIHQTAEVSSDDINEFNSLFREAARILAMSNAEKQSYLDEKYNYPRHITDGKWNMELKDYASAVKCFQRALTAKRTSEAERLLKQAKEKAEEQRILSKWEAQYDLAMEQGKTSLRSNKWDEAEKAFDKALAVPGYEHDGDAKNRLKIAKNGAELKKKREYAESMWKNAREKVERILQEVSRLTKDSFQGTALCDEGISSLAGLSGQLESLPPSVRSRAKKLKSKLEAEKKRFDLNFTISNLGIKMVWVAPGSFLMGSNDENSNEKPVHQVTISKGYWIGKCEVTQREYREIMGNNPSHFKGNDNPVEQVSWSDAVKFCEKLTARERGAGCLPKGYVYRLPTEAEWEFAARGGTKSKGYKYSGSNELDSVAWYSNNSVKKTHKVGSKSGNELGIHDMSGNVWEWCYDRYGDYAPESQANPTGAPDGSFRTLRGGSWGLYAACCRSTIRGRDKPHYSDNDYFGFRIARAAPVQK